MSVREVEQAILRRAEAALSVAPAQEMRNQSEDLVASALK
jgi:hypothetical protein